MIHYSASYGVRHGASLTLKPRYFYAGPTFAVTELDGVRVIGGDTCDFIQKVPGDPSFLQSQAVSLTSI